MIKVMIVEDVDIIREDVIRLINWQEHGFIVIAEARNGEMGLEMFRKHKPEIVITDIRMPVMTGLDMIQEIQKTDKDTQFILLTDYGEFEYAKKAMYLDVHSYLLKYELDDDMLLRELEKVRAIVEKQRNINRMTKSEYLKDWLIHGKREADDPQSFFGWYGHCSLIVIDAKGFDRKSSELYNDLREQLNSEAQTYEFEYIEMSPQEYVIFLKVSESFSELKSMNYIRTFISRLQTLFRETCALETAAAVGAYIYGSGDVADAYRKTKKLLQQKVFYPKSCIIDFPPPEPPAARKEEVAQLLKSIRSNIQNLNADELHDQIPRLFTGLLRAIKSTELLENSVRELTFAIASRSVQGKTDNMGEVLDEIMDSVRNYNVYVLAELFDKAIEMLGADFGTRYSKRVNAIIRYISEHYGDDISLYDLSKELDLSVIYISQLFKKEVGITFSAYLTKVRIDKAIELLRTGRYKVYEVSKMVGYQTVQYFSNIFKKETGKKPGDFC